MIKEEHRPLTVERAQELRASAPKRSIGTEYRSRMTEEEQRAVHTYWWYVAPPSWSFNDVVRACAKAPKVAS